MNDKASALVTIFLGTIISPFALLFSFLFLLPVGWLQYHVLRELCGALGIPTHRPGERFATAILPLVSTASYAVLAYGAHAAFDDASVIAGVVTIGAVVLALISAPLSLYVPACMDALGKPSIDAALRQWDAVPRSRKALLVGLRASPITAATVTFLLASRVGELEGLELAGVACPYVLGLWLYQWEVLKTYQRTPAAPITSAIASTRWRLMFPAALAVLLAAPLLIACARAVSHPAPMQSSRSPEGRVYLLQSGHTVDGSALRIVPAPDGVDVFDGENVSAHVDFGFGCAADPQAEISIQEDSPSGHRVFIHTCGRWHRFDVSETGLRQTTLMDRLSRRLGYSVLVPLFLGVSLLLLALVWLLPSMAHARRIASVVRREELESAIQESILEGTLRLPSGTRRFAQERSLLETSDASIEIVLEGDRFRLPLPSSVPCAKGRYEDGTIVSLVGVFSSVSRGHRDSTIPWPKRAFLVSSPADEAREVWLWKATRAARLAAIASTLILVASYAFLVLG